LLVFIFISPILIFSFYILAGEQSMGACFYIIEVSSSAPPVILFLLEWEQAAKVIVLSDKRLTN